MPKPHFGELLRSLRTARRMTQQELAESARVSAATIHRAEQEASCTWRRSTATDVLGVLDRVAPLSPADQAAYLDGAGLTAIAALGAQAIRAHRAETRTIHDAADGAGPPDADHITSHNYVEELIQERGAKNVLTALEGIAAAWGVDLRPRVRPSDAEGPRWILWKPPTIEEGHVVQEAHPVPRPVPPAVPQKRKASR